MAVKPIPEGYTTVTPWILSHDTAGVIDFVKAAFGAEELYRVEMEGGTIGHAEVRIGDAIVMMFDTSAAAPASPAYLRLYVEDAHAVHKAAVDAGGTSVTDITHMPFGDLVGRVRDPFGNLWWIHTRIEDVEAEELERRFSDPKFQKAMQYVMGAELVKP